MRFCYLVYTTFKKLIEKQKQCTLVLEFDIVTVLPKPDKNLIRDTTIYQDMSFTAMTINVNGIEFRAHKCFLVAN